MDYLVFATKKGTVKRTKASEYEAIRQSGLLAITLGSNDSLLSVKATSGNSLILLVSKMGKSILFDENDVRPTGRSTQGVRGILLKNDDELVGMTVIEKEAYAQKSAGELLVITENGYGKQTALSGYSVQGRGGQGVFTAKITKKTGNLVDMRLITKIDEKTPPEETEVSDDVDQSGDLLVTSAKGQAIRLPIADVPSLGRQTQGVRIIKLNEGDTATALAIL
ncbi:hypothetical protein GW793_02860 [bacterium]|uniref:DNA gyrase subunit A n=2 Tax=Katanobacteria TaxID=422282 RepID=A0A2M7X241_UNCKA|nr:hypothetical protein [bacterium]PIP56962.1 MAG: hypothetical protein COX05_00275 [candidate division WWE3 bacterium CG22_combo_CG10-13_8_21_14_all_39_12]PJA40232.1 MAG: hypothetical protein CO179_02885 [candidate division WWE3 bacterium CG_4_9_14_3_um_filter_39_7]